MLSLWGEDGVGGGPAAARFSAGAAGEEVWGRQVLSLDGPAQEQVGDSRKYGCGAGGLDVLQTHVGVAIAMFGAWGRQPSGFTDARLLALHLHKQECRAGGMGLIA